MENLKNIHKDILWVEKRIVRTVQRANTFKKETERNNAMNEIAGYMGGSVDLASNS